MADQDNTSGAKSELTLVPAILPAVPETDNEVSVSETVSEPQSDTESQPEPPELSEPTSDEGEQTERTPIEAHIYELGILCDAAAAILNGMVYAIKNTKMESEARSIVLQNIIGAQNDYFHKRIELAGYRLLTHFEGDINATLRSLDQAVMRASSNIALVSADGFDKGSGQKVI